jgi:hypothetical protein
MTGSVHVRTCMFMLRNSVKCRIEANCTTSTHWLERYFIPTNLEEEWGMFTCSVGDNSCMHGVQVPTGNTIPASSYIVVQNSISQPDLAEGDSHICGKYGFEQPRPE